MWQNKTYTINNGSVKVNGDFEIVDSQGNS
jgi:hypothetical protein